MVQKAKNLPAMQGSIPRMGRLPGEENGYPLWYSGLENPMDRGAQQATVHGVAKSQTRLSDFHFSCGVDRAGVTQSNHFTDMRARDRGTGGHVNQTISQTGELETEVQADTSNPTIPQTGELETEVQADMSIRPFHRHAS